MPLDNDGNWVRPNLAKINNEPSMTVQSEAEFVDLDKLVRRHQATGEWVNVPTRTPQYGDSTGPRTLQQALDQVEAAHAEFEALPARVRSRVSNDPVVLLEWLTDPEKAQELADMGLPIEGLEPSKPARGGQEPESSEAPGAAASPPEPDPNAQP